MLNIVCPECEFMTHTTNEMEKHILTVHPNYTPQQAKDTARFLTEDAQDQADAEEALFYKDQYNELPSDRDPL